MAAGDTLDRHRKWLVPLAVVLGVVLIVIAVIYWVEPAHSLPSFFPGHEAGSRPPSREARHRRLPGRAGVPRLRLVQHRAEEARRRADRRRLSAPDQLLPERGARAAPGCVRAVPGLEPRSHGHPPEPLRLGHPPERAVLPDLPRRSPPRDRDRAARVLLAGLGADHQGARPLVARPGDHRTPTRGSAGCSSSRRSRPESSG